MYMGPGYKYSREPCYGVSCSQYFPSAAANHPTAAALTNVTPISSQPIIKIKRLLPIIGYFQKLSDYKRHINGQHPGILRGITADPLPARQCTPGNKREEKARAFLRAAAACKYRVEGKLSSRSEAPVVEEVQAADHQS